MAEKSSKADKIFTFFNNLSPAIVAFVGVFVGAGLQYCSQQALEEKSKFLDQRLEAYGDFFESVAIGYAINDERKKTPTDSEKISKLQSEYIKIHYDARFRLAVFGTSPVVTRLAEFYKNYRKTGPCTEGTREQWLADTAIYNNMRQEIYEQDKTQTVLLENLNIILWNCTVPSENKAEN